MLLVLCYEDNVYLDLLVYFSLYLLFIPFCFTDFPFPFGIFLFFFCWNKQIFSSEVGLWQSLSVFVLSLFSKKFLFWNTFPIFSYLLSEHWALSLLSSFSISFENSVVTAVVTSLKLIYRLSLAAFKFFVCWGCFSGFFFFFFCLWCLEFHFDISGCVFMF